jgi:hypothetical protein
MLDNYWVSGAGLCHVRAHHGDSAGALVVQLAPIGGDVSPRDLLAAAVRSVNGVLIVRDMGQQP